MKPVVQAIHNNKDRRLERASGTVEFYALEPGFLQLMDYTVTVVTLMMIASLVGLATVTLMCTYAVCDDCVSVSLCVFVCESVLIHLLFSSVQIR